MSPRREIIARSIAVVIAVAAVIDPAIVVSRRSRPEIALVTAPGDSSAARLRRDLSRSYNVVDGPADGADATIWDNDAIPDRADLTRPVYVLQSDARPMIERIDAPRRMQMRESATLLVTLQTPDTGDHDVSVALDAGSVTVDRANRTVHRGAGATTIPLVFTPSHAGITPLRISVRSGSATSVRDLAVDVRDARIAILFFDPSASWQSTFIRRSIEKDPRFVVTSRIGISRGIASREGQPPAVIASAADLDAFDVVIAGGTAGLDAATTSALDHYLRTRKGVVMVLPSSAKDAALMQTTGVAQWLTSADPHGIAIHAGTATHADTATILAGETIWPTALPLLAAPVARDAAGHAIVWSIPVGSGQLIINGATDAWRFRDPAVSAFDRFWPALLSSEVTDAVPPNAITLSQSVAAPRDVIEATAQWTSAPSGSLRASIRNEKGDTTSVPLFPEDHPDQQTSRWNGAFRAPSKPGQYVVGIAGQPTGTAGLVVERDASTTVTSPAILGAWAAASGGTVIPASRIADLRGDLRRRIPTSVQRTSWHPMRTPWWIIPFVLAIASEWYWRRRRGLP